MLLTVWNSASNIVKQCDHINSVKQHYDCKMQMKLALINNHFIYEWA